jgi:hypothetical protein
MFKIIIRHESKSIKTKYYETKEEFNKWLIKHTKNYKCYIVLGFELVSLKPCVWERRTLKDIEK